MFDDYFPFGLKAEFLAHQNRPPSAVLRSQLRPARASRVLARPGRLPLSRTRGTDGMSRRPEEMERGTKPMNTIAEFTIIGRVGEIRQVGTTLRVNIASSYSRKDQSRRMGRAHPLERSHRLRRVHPRLRQSQHRQGRSRLHLGRDGPNEVGEGRRNVLRYRHARRRTHRALCKGPNHDDDKDDEPQEKRRAPVDDSGRHPVLTAHPRTGEASASPPSRGPIGEDAKDRRIKPNEARLIHALLRGRG